MKSLTKPPLLITEASLEAANRGWAPLRSRGELPHLYKPGGTYFVTFRLWDAVSPAVHASKVVEGTKSAQEESNEPEAIATQYEPPLTAGSCVLRRPEIAGVIMDALEHFDGQRYGLHAWCVMPNHVHVVVTLAGEHRLSDILHSWKSFTANQVNRRLGRTGALWERESFDHLIRNYKSFGKFVIYTETNPLLAGLCARPEDWPYSSVSWVRGAGWKPAPQGVCQPALPEVS